MGGLGQRTRHSGGGGFAGLPFQQMLFVRLCRMLWSIQALVGGQMLSAKAPLHTKIMIIKIKTTASPLRSSGLVNVLHFI